MKNVTKILLILLIGCEGKDNNRSETPIEGYWKGLCHIYWEDMDEITYSQYTEKYSSNQYEISLKYYSDSSCRNKSELNGLDDKVYTGKYYFSKIETTSYGESIYIYERESDLTSINNQFSTFTAYFENDIMYNVYRPLLEGGEYRVDYHDYFTKYNL